MGFEVSRIVGDSGSRSHVAPVVVGGDGWAGRWLRAAQALLHGAEPVLHLACAAAVGKDCCSRWIFGARERLKQGIAGRRSKVDVCLFASMLCRT